MKTEFSFESNGTVTATPEGVVMSGKSGNIWTFRRDGLHVGKTFMADRSTRAQIIEQFRLSGSGY